MCVCVLDPRVTSLMQRTTREEEEDDGPNTKKKKKNGLLSLLDVVVVVQNKSGWKKNDGRGRERERDGRQRVIHTRTTQAAKDSSFLG